VSALSIRELHLQAGGFRVGPITLEINPDEYFVLMGPTGSGKSLMIKAVSGLIELEKGTVAVNGLDVTRLEPRFRRIGYVPQNSDLFPHLNVEQNLAFACRVAGLNRRAAMDEIAPVVEMLRIEHLLKRATTRLSGGEKQKVALGRALMRKPEVLLLDEPVSALDEPNRRDVCQALHSVKQDLHIATIHVCHSVAEARLVSDRVGVIADGKLVQVGTVDALIASPADSVIRSLLNTEG